MFRAGKVIKNLISLCFNKRCKVLNKGFNHRQQWKDLGFFKFYKVHVITFLPSLKKVVVYLGKLFGNLSRFNIVLIKKTAQSGVLSRR